MRAALASLLLLSACAPEPEPEPEPPPTPTLEPLVSPTPFSSVTLRGTAPPDSVVRVFVDEACAGPVLREVSSAALAAGVQVDLVPDANVFTVRASTSRGVRSACSEPVRVRFERQPPPATPTLRSEPPSPTNSRRVRLVGSAPSAEVVHVFREGGCLPETLVTTVSREQFELHGVPVETSTNVVNRWFVQSVDVTGQRSDCAGVVVWVDLAPPTLRRVEVASPNPSNSPYALLRIEALYPSDVAEYWVYPSRGCKGPATFACADVTRSCLFPWKMTPSELRWSAQAFDLAGNGVCVDASEVVRFEPAPNEPLVELSADGILLVTRVPWDGLTVRWVAYFNEANCAGRVVREVDAWAAVEPVFVDPGTVWSARLRVLSEGRLVDGKCGATVVMPQ
jgi:hypothetical protein